MRQRYLTREQALEEYVIYRKRVRELLDMAQISRDIRSGKYEPRDLLGRGPERFSHSVGNALMGIFASLLDPQNHALNVFDLWVVLFPGKKNRISETWEAVKPRVKLIRAYRNDIACHSNKSLQRQAKTYVNYHKHFDQIVDAMQKVSRLAAELMRDEARTLPNLRAEIEPILDRALTPLTREFGPNQQQALLTEMKNYFLRKEEGHSMRLTTNGAHLYLATSQIALVHGILSWDEYLLRLRFLKDCAERGTLEARAAMDALEAEEFGGDDDWPTGDPEQPIPGEAPEESEVSISDGHGPLESPVLHFVAAGSTGLQEWQFHQFDADFFPSIPHGHPRQGRSRKLDVYRGWIYTEDRQDGREPRRRIIALWNDEKFRTFASSAIHYYLVAYPKYRWPVLHPLRLPRRR